MKYSIETSDWQSLAISRKASLHNSELLTNICSLGQRFYTFVLSEDTTVKSVISLDAYFFWFPNSSGPDYSCFKTGECQSILLKYHQHLTINHHIYKTLDDVDKVIPNKQSTISHIFTKLKEYCKMVA